MLQITRVGEDNIIEIQASGKLTDEEYRQFLPELEQLINRQGPVSIFVDMEEFEGWETRAAWDDFTFGLAHDVDFRRIAVVADRKWIEWMIRISNIFFSAEMRCFPVGRKEEAMNWLREWRQDEKQEGAADPLTPYSHILLATDFSPHARRAAERALELAGQYQARLSLVHVVENFILYGDFIEPTVIDQITLEQQMQEAAQKQLDSLAEDLQLDSADNVHLLIGTPKHALLSFARDHKVDLIVLGSHGRRGVERLLGSVAAGIVNAAPCDVLTVRI